MKGISVIVPGFLIILPCCAGSGGTSSTAPTHKQNNTPNWDAGAPAEDNGAVAGEDAAIADSGPPVTFVPWPASGEPCDPAPVTTAPAAMTTPTRVVTGDAVPLGVTSDGYVVYRKYPMFQAVKIGSTDEPVDLSETPGAVLIRDHVVFHWENVDYTTNTGDLMMFSAPSCGRTLGTTPLDEDFFVASADGSLVLYATNATANTMDIVLASRDLVHQQTLVAGVGRGSETTCRPKYGFAGDRVLAAYCMEGSQAATVQVYALQDDQWVGTQLSDDATATWSADASGDRIVYVTSGAQARLWDGETSTVIDEGVSWAQVLPDGSAMLYAVGDQLRRTTLPNIVPIPIVTNKFRTVVAWSSDYSRVLYSSNVIYEPVQGQDLIVAPTTQFTAVPPVLVADPVARLSRSSLTADGNYALYLIGSDDNEAGTLYVSPVNGAPGLTIDGVDTVLAAREDLIVFSTNRSDPNAYPITADLQALRAGGDSMPVLVQADIVDGRSFYVTADGKAVVYARPAIPDPGVQGIWVQAIP